MTDEQIKALYSEATGYARSLAAAIVSKHYPENTNWKPLPDLIGILTQIDNATTGLTRAADGCRCPEHGSWVSKDDQDRLVRELDVLLNGEDGAAKQASLCDIVSQVRREKLSLYRGPHPAPPADDEIDAIRARHEDFARVIIWSPRGHAEDAHADRATLLRALDAERARRLADMQAAFDAGFMVSGEGWNGEYPGDAPGTEYYIERRIEAIATITKETP